MRSAYFLYGNQELERLIPVKGWLNGTVGAGENFP